jgi:hypothetical protein
MSLVDLWYLTGGEIVTAVSLGQEEFSEIERRAWDSNPRGRVNALMVFKTIAIGH